MWTIIKLGSVAAGLFLALTYLAALTIEWHLQWP